MPVRTSNVRNDYRCSIEKNQGGKYCVRIRVHYPRHAWSLGVFFLASSFDRAMKKLEESLDFLQRHEEKLWFWGVDRAEDMGFSAEFLREVGMKLDQRTEFPRKSASLAVVPEKSVPAAVLGLCGEAWPSRSICRRAQPTPRTDARRASSFQSFSFLTSCFPAAIISPTRRENPPLSLCSIETSHHRNDGVSRSLG
jgi:hypothetical protein